MQLTRTITWEHFMLGLLMAGSFIGIWFGAPLVDVSADEMYFVGGVFRALAAHSLIPLAGDVPYGTITFYLNYIFEIPVLVVVYLAHHANLAETKTFLIFHPIIGYIVTRFVSATIVSGFIWWYNRFLKAEGLPLLHRVTALSVAVMTLLPVYMLHSGKMWVLSTVLATVALLYLYAALKYADREQGKKYAFWCVIVSGIAAANFPLAGLLLLNAPVLFVRQATFRKPVVKATLIALGTILAVFLINARNIIAQVYDIFFNYHAVFTTQAAGSIKISTLASLALHAEQIAITFPLTIVLIVFAVSRSAWSNRLLRTIALSYALAYVAVLIFLVTWNSDPVAFLRHMLPLAFFLSVLVASFDFNRIKQAIPPFLLLQAVFYVYALYLLSVPMTYNVARDFAMHSYATSTARIYDHLEAIDFPLNKATAALTKDKFCQSKCAYVRAAESDVAFKPAIVTSESDISKVPTTKFQNMFYIGTSTLPGSCEPKLVATFSQGSESEVSLEYQFGSYAAPLVSRLGATVYVESFAKPCSEAGF